MRTQELVAVDRARLHRLIRVAILAQEAERLDRWARMSLPERNLTNAALLVARAEGAKGDLNEALSDLRDDDLKG